MVINATSGYRGCHTAYTAQRFSVRRQAVRTDLFHIIGEESMNVEEVHTELQEAKLRIQSLEKKLHHHAVGQPHQQELPATSLLSDKFLTRAFAVLGHYIVAALIISVPLYVIIFIMMMAVGVFSGGFSY